MCFMSITLNRNFTPFPLLRISMNISIPAFLYWFPPPSGRNAVYANVQGRTLAEHIV